MAKEIEEQEKEVAKLENEFFEEEDDEEDDDSNDDSEDNHDDNDNDCNHASNNSDDNEDDSNNKSHESGLLFTIDESKGGHTSKNYRPLISPLLKNCGFEFADLISDSSSNPIKSSKHESNQFRLWMMREKKQSKLH